MPYGKNEQIGLTEWKAKTPHQALHTYFCDILEVLFDVRATLTLGDILNKDDVIKCDDVDLNKDERLLKIGKEADDFFIWLYRVFVAENNISHDDKKTLWEETKKHIPNADIVTDDTVNYDDAIAHGGVAQPLNNNKVRVSKVISNILGAVHNDANLFKKFESTEIPLPKSLDSLLNLAKAGNEEQKQRAITKLELLWEKYGEIRNNAAFGEKRFKMNALNILNKEELQKVFSENFKIYKEKGTDLPKHLQAKDGVYNIENVFGLKGSAKPSIATLVSGSIQDKVRTRNESILNGETNNKNTDRLLKGIMAESLNKAMEKAIETGKMIDDEWNENKENDIYKNKKEIIKEIIQFAQKHNGVNFDKEGNSLKMQWKEYQEKNPILSGVPYLMACSFSKAYQDSMKEQEIYTGQSAKNLLKNGLDYQDIGARLTRIPAKDINDVIQRTGKRGIVVR